MSDDELAAIKARHESIEVMERTATPPLWLVTEIAAQAHADRAALLAEVERLTADAAALRELKQAASDLDAAAEDAGRGHYADRAQAAREALECGR